MSPPDSSERRASSPSAQQPFSDDGSEAACCRSHEGTPSESGLPSEQSSEANVFESCASLKADGSCSSSLRGGGWEQRTESGVSEDCRCPSSLPTEEGTGVESRKEAASPNRRQRERRPSEDKCIRVCLSQTKYRVLRHVCRGFKNWIQVDSEDADWVNEGGRRKAAASEFQREATWQEPFPHLPKQ